MLRAPPLFITLPAERGVERHAINPGALLRLAPKSRQRHPELQGNFLQQILRVVRRHREGANDLPHQPGAVRQPAAEDGFLL